MTNEGKNVLCTREFAARYEIINIFYYTDFLRRIVYHFMEFTPIHILDRNKFFSHKMRGRFFFQMKENTRSLFSK